MDLQSRLRIYEASHRHPVNVACHFVGIPLILASLALLLWDVKLAAGLFAVGWVFQFVGHYFEGVKPSFFEDLNYLWVGPFFLAKKVMDWRRGASR